VTTVRATASQIVTICRVWLCATGGSTQKPMAKSWTSVLSLAELRAGIETPRRAT
jgi:hypothetical protein